MSSSLLLNSFILSLFLLCTVWQLGVLSYYSRSAKVLNKLLSMINPALSQNKKRGGDAKKQAMHVASSLAGTLADSPLISKALSMAIKTSRVELTHDSIDAMMSHVQQNGDSIISLSKFLTSLFTMLGLLGTFLGLLQTIDGVSRALGALSNVADFDVLGFVKLLADPLKGMAVAFSTSLFGLVASLFGNYGNYVAAQKLSNLIVKLRNLLLSTAVTPATEGEQISAKDILMALDDSFNKLYIGLSERLDLLADSVISMSKAIVRTHERQEKALKIVIDSLSSLEQIMSYLPRISKSLDKLNEAPPYLGSLIVDSRNKVIEFLNTTVVNTLKTISGDLDNNVKLTAGVLKATADNVELNKRSLEVSEEGVSIMQDGVEEIATSNVILKDVAGMSIDIAQNTSENNDISKDILNKIVGTDYTPMLIDLIKMSDSLNNTSANSRDLLESLDSKKIDDQLLIEGLEDVVESVDNVSDGVGAVIDFLEGDHIDVLTNINDTTVDILDYLNNQKSEDMLEAIQDAVESVAESVSSINTGIDDLHDLVESAVLPNVERIADNSDELVDSLESANETLEDISTSNQGILEVSELTSTYLEGMESSLNNALDGMQNIYDMLYGNLEELKITFDGFRQDISDMFGIFESSVEVARRLQESADNIHYTCTTLNEHLAFLNETMGHAAPALYEIIESTNRNTDAVASVLDILSNVEAYSAGVHNFTEMVNGQLDYLVQASGGILEYVGGIYENNQTNAEREYAITTAMDNLVNQFTDLKYMYENEFYRISEEVTSTLFAVSGMFEDVSYNLSSLVPVSQKLDDLLNRIAGDDLLGLAAISESLYLMSESYNSFAYEMRSLVDTTVGTFANATDTIIGSLYGIQDNTIQQTIAVTEATNLLYGLANQFEGTMSGLVMEYNNMQADMANLVQAFSSSTSMFDEITSTVGSMTDAITYAVGAIGDIAGTFGSLEANFNGMSDGLYQIISQLSDQASITGNSVYAFGELSENLSLMSNTLFGLTDSMTSISINIGDWLNANNSFQESQSNIAEISTVLSELNYNISNLLNVSADQNNNFSGFVDRLSYEMNNFADRLTSEIDILSSSLGGNVGGLTENLANEVANLAYASQQLSNDVGGLTNGLEREVANLSYASQQLGNDVGGLTNGLETEVANLAYASQQLGNDVGGLTNGLEKEVANLTYVAQELVNTVNGLADIGGMYQELVAINNSLDSLRNLVPNSAGGMSDEGVNAILSSLDRLSDISLDMKDSIVNAVSSGVMQGYQNDSEGLVQRLDNVLGYLEENVSLGNNNSRNVEELINILSSLRDEAGGTNMKMNIVASAVDSLITELLNSREVTETILNLVSRLGSGDVR
jgi:methyl-accepting chemotaxis protein